MRNAFTALLTCSATFACSGGSDSSSQRNDQGGDVIVDGQLILDDYTANVRPDTLLVMKTLGGSLDQSTGGTQQLELDNDGFFSANLSKADQTLDALKAAVGDGKNIDRKAIKSILGAQASGVDDLSDKELASELNSIIAQSESRGGPIYLLIGAAFGGKSSLTLSLEDKAAIAETFQFVGLPVASNNFIGIPAQSAKSNLSLGDVTKDEGDEAKSELQASVDIFDLTDAAISQLSSVGGVLKGVKNAFINENWTATPFFLWGSYSSGKSVIKNQFSSPSDLTFRGYGFYIGGDNTPFGFDNVCNEDESLRKTLKLIPPSELVVETGESQQTITPDNPFTNSGSQTFDTQGGNPTCSSDSFFAREDGDNQFMINFGTGGGIQAEDGIPSGFWRLKYQESLLGIFDLGTASPFDGDGKPVIFIPAVKAVVDNGDYITKVEVRFYYFNKAQSKYVKVTDVSALQRILSSLKVEITRDSSTGSDSDPTEIHEDLEHKSNGLYQSAAFGTKYKITGTENDTDPVARDVSVYYEIGDNTYRFEYRDAF